MKRKIIYSFLLGVSAMLITACGSNSKDNAGDMPPSESGITASIACFESEQLTKAYVAHCYVHAVDGNSNPVSGLSFAVSLVNGVKVLQEGTGNILTTDPISFSDDVVNFAQTDVKKTDNLIILPTATTTDPTYLGNWEISEVNVNLTLAENSFSLETTEDLTYVIGNETRYDLGGSASAHIEYPDDSNTSGPEDVEGFFYFDVVYDPALRGETIFLGAHTFGNRIGTASAIILELEGEITPPGENTTVPPDGSTETPGECGEGYFWCSIDQKCMPSGDTTSSCS